MSRLTLSAAYFYELLLTATF